jgi:hypothetical protein
MSEKYKIVPTCTRCGLSFKTVEEKWEHERRKHLLTCDVCGREFEDFEVKQAHENSCLCKSLSSDTNCKFWKDERCTNNKAATGGAIACFGPLCRIREPKDVVILDVRQEVLDFAIKMEDVLKVHDSKKGNSWRKEIQTIPNPRYEPWEVSQISSVEFFKRLLKEEINEFEVTDDPDELIDVANVCMMLHYHLTRVDEQDRCSNCGVTLTLKPHNCGKT